MFNVRLHYAMGCSAEFLFEDENLGTLFAAVAEIAFEDFQSDCLQHAFVFSRNDLQVVALGWYENAGNRLRIKEIGSDVDWKWERPNA